MTTNTSPTRFRLDNVRCDWPNLFKGEQFQGTGKFRCGVQLLVPTGHPQYKAIETAITESANTKWKDKAAQTLKVARAKDNVCFRDGDLKAKAPEGYAGSWILSANCKGGDTEAECDKPTVYDAARNKVTEASKSPIYRGCYVNALVEFYADSRFGDGVFCKLVGIQFQKDGDAFGSAPARADDFDDVVEGAGADDFV
jgi:Protein of unknown function (DUF2815)